MFTRIPIGANSTARFRQRLSTAPFVAAYADNDWDSHVDLATTLLMKTMLPLEAPNSSLGFLSIA